MIKWRILAALWLASSVQVIQAEPDREMVYRLKGSIAKVHVVTKTGGHGMGSGVVVGKDLVATNCHILANASGVNIAKFGDSVTPVALKADWAHDLCILKFQYLQLKPAVLADTDNLQYEQEIFSIGFPGGPPKPLTTYGYIKALYPFEDAHIIRTSASFVMGASGSPVFNQAGELVGISTFKSPGKGAYYYNIPVKWIKRLLDAPDIESMATDIAPFWDAAPENRPYFMRVVHPYQHADWPALERIATQWLLQSSQNAEAHYYLGIASLNQGKTALAKASFDQALLIQPRHTASMMALGQMADKAGDQATVEKIHAQLKRINALLDQTFIALLAKGKLLAQ